MANLLTANPAAGRPGIEPHWTRSDKDGVGTGYSALSRVWFTVSKGILRYNHDGYGQREDGGPFGGWGYGHAWPVLTGERGHYELAAGRDVRPFIRAMERFATSTHLLPEQVWALPDLPRAHMALGRPTGGAMPLVWAHAEYLKLVRSAADRLVVDLIPAVADRYRSRPEASPLEIWKFNRQVRSLPDGGILRIQANSPFRLHWTCDEWTQAHDTNSTSVDAGLEYVDIRPPPGQRAPIRFCFFWPATGRWEGRDFQVLIDAGGVGRLGRAEMSRVGSPPPLIATSDPQGSS